MEMLSLVFPFLLFATCLFRSSTPRLADDVAQRADMPYESLSNYNCVKDSCFHQPESACPSPESKCRCRKLPNCKNAAICCDVSKFYLTEGLACANISTNSNIEALHIRNATLDELNLGLAAYKKLRYMTITDGNIKRVVGEFSKYAAISCLNLSSNGITHFENRSIVNLFNISTLDLSHNNLTDVPRFKKEGQVHVDISDNKMMQCTNVYDALKRSDELRFNNENSTICISAKTFHWFNSSVTVPLSQIIGLHELRKSCIQNCTCEPTRLDLVEGQEPTYAVAMNCAGQKFLSLPKLPSRTISLNISNNNISSLESLGTDTSYLHLRELFADNNQITSILPLEGTNFMDHFMVLTLRNNKIKTLPTYIFSNNFHRTVTDRYMYFGKNRLLCDCTTAKVLRVWLLTKQKNIPDYNEIACENDDLTVMELNPTKLCQSEQEWTDYIYYIITAEILLFFGLVSKVFYDYWVFKTTGYLPWPASKMPKLPCDWLCE